MTQKLFLSAIIAILVAAAPAVADASKSMKVGVIDLQRIHQDAKASKQLQIQIEKQRADFQTDLTKVEEQLRTLEKTLIEDQKKLSEADFNKKRQDFETKVAEAQKKVAAQRESWENGFSIAVGEMRKSLEKIANDIAVKEGYTLMLPLAAVLYFDASYDITDQVLKILDERLPVVDLKPAS